MKHYERALELIDQAQDLLEQARLADNNDLKLALMDQADRLYAEARALADQPARWLGLGRTGWMRLQWMVGVGNAFGVFYRLDRGELLSAVVSALCVLIVARWSFSPHATKRNRNGT